VPIIDLSAPSGFTGQLGTELSMPANLVLGAAPSLASVVTFGLIEGTGSVSGVIEGTGS